MWTLPKPDLGASKNDLRDIESHSDSLDKGHFPIIEDLYDTYDFNGGHVSDRQHDGVPDEAKRGLRGAYEKTYKGGHHKSIADALKANVDKCPMCSIGNTDTLDHYMEKAKYPALAMMRQNLVPMCGYCNGKRNENKVDHTEMIHAYYDPLPTDRQWLKADLSIGGGAISARFYPDSTVLTDATLYNKALKTIQGLDLNETIRKDMMSFLSSLLCGKGGNDKVIKALIRIKYQEFRDNSFFGINHWKTVLLKSLTDYPTLTCADLSTYIKGKP